MKVFQFSEQSEGVSLSATIDDVGGKGLSLLRMSRLGVPVPPGFIVPVTVCRTYLQDGALPPEFDTPNKVKQLIEREVGNVATVTLRWKCGDGADRSWSFVTFESAEAMTTCMTKGITLFDDHLQQNVELVSIVNLE